MRALSNMPGMLRALGLLLVAGTGCSEGDEGRCSMAVNNSCITPDRFCDQTGQCQPCPPNTANCDGDNFNSCEFPSSSCSATTCTPSCPLPGCCAEGVCHAPGQPCAGGGTCDNGICGSATPWCNDCPWPSCCDDGVCLDPGAPCPGGGRCDSGACFDPCASCSAPRCCDDGACLEPGQPCSSGGSCSAGACEHPCTLCVFPYCCDAGRCRVPGQSCSAGGTCVDGSCGAASCTDLGQWPAVTGSGGYDPLTRTTHVEAPAPADQATRLRLEFLHDPWAPPRKVVISENLRLADCRTVGVCARLGTGCSGAGLSGCQKVFLARAGTLEVTRADRLFADGSMQGSLTDVRFVEWNEAADQAAPGWTCHELGSAGLAASW